MLKKSEIKVSIIMPVYNSEEFLEQAIDSVLENGLEDFEIICINDGSTDSSINILERLAKEDKRIKVYSTENGGPSKARNLGLEKAIGKYIIFMDSDDILPKDSLDLRVQAIEKSKSDVAIGGTNRFNNKKEWRMEKHYFEEGEKDILRDLGLLRSLGPCNKIYRKDNLDNIKFNEELNYAEDVAWVLEVLLRGEKIYTINKCVYKYRYREGSLTSYKGREKEILRNAIKSAEVVFAMFDDIGLEKDKKNLKINYLERVIDVDIWPAYKNIKDNKEKKEITLEVFKMLENLDEEAVKDSYKVKIFIVKNIYENYLVYKGSDKSFKEDIRKKIEGIYKTGDLEEKEYLKVLISFFENEKKSILLKYLIKEKIKRVLKSV